MTQTAMVKIKNASVDAKLLKEQKRFNKLTKDLEKYRQSLRELNDEILVYKKHYVEDIVPLQQKHNQLAVILSYFIDTHFDEKVFSNADRKRMCILLDEIIGGFDPKDIDEKLKDIYNRRLDSDYDEVVQETSESANQEIHDILEKMFGMDIDVDINKDPRLFQQELQQKMFEKLEEEQQREAQKPPRKKSARTLAKEAREKEAQDLQSKSIREVYRQLAKSLHPDRIADDEDYEVKNQLMQEVNAAYDKQDLLTLLSIQLKIEQIDQDHIDGIAIEKLKHFNAILKNQLDELDYEISMVFEKFKFEYPNSEIFSPFATIMFKSEIKKLQLQLQREYKAKNDDIALWKTDLKAFRGYIRESIDLNKSKDDFLFNPFEVAEMMSLFDDAPIRTRRK